MSKKTSSQLPQTPADLPSYVHDPIWAEALRRYIKSEKAKSGLTYDDISHRLYTTFATVQTSANLKSKVARANFGAQLFLQLLIVMGAAVININEVHDLYNTIKREQT